MVDKYTEILHSPQFSGDKLDKISAQVSEQTASQDRAISVLEEQVQLLRKTCDKSEARSKFADFVSVVSILIAAASLAMQFGLIS